MSYIAENYAIDSSHINKKYKEITEEYFLKHPTGNKNEINSIFNCNILHNIVKNRKLNIGICCFAFTVGGGEFFPIHLANALKKLGHAVTFLDFDFDERNPMVRAALSPDIAVVYAPHAKDFSQITAQLGLDVLHSHHGSVDHAINTFAPLLKCKHLVTFHGYYEAINDEKQALTLLKKLKSKAHFVYTADKNITLAREAGINVSALEKIPNGLPPTPVGKLKRESLGLLDDDFVLCLVSRALPTKGWAEAVEIVDLANKKSSRPVHLLLIGEGEMYDKLKGLSSTHIHLLGNQYALQEFYAISDMGFLPSRYPGESFPLVNIECLLTGTPIIASNIGEIAKQLTTENGDVAGACFDLDNGSIPIEKVVDIIISFINDKQLFEEAKKHAGVLSTKFDIISVAQKYIKIYRSLVVKEKIFPDIKKHL